MSWEGIALFVLLEVHFLVTGRSSLFVEKEWNTTNVFNVMTGANLVLPTSFMKILSLIFVLTFLFSFIHLIRIVFNHPNRNYVLKIGIGITILSVLNEILNSARVIDCVSLMFLSKGIEILRISESLRRKSFDRIDTLQHELTEVSKRAATAFITNGLMHDIRGPLTVILGHLMKISSIGAKLRKQAAFIDTKGFEQMGAELEHSETKFRSNIGRINSMITSYLDILRDTNKVNHRPINLDAILMGALELSQPRMQNANVKEIELGSVPAVSIKGVKSQLEMIFANIINNAIDAIKDKEDAWIKISCSGTETEVSIKVSNLGRMPEDVLSKILKGESVSSKGELGNGIGLRIVSELCRAYKAKMTIYNEEQMTHVVVTLPATIDVVVVGLTG